jgi:hypothetical protein
MKPHTKLWMDQIRAQMNKRALKLQWVQNEITLALENERRDYLVSKGLLEAQQ